MGMTPYKLVQDHGVSLPTETHLQIIRVAKQDELLFYDYWNVLFDKLNEFENERLNTLEKLIRHKEILAKIYNCQIKVKNFNKGDLVWKIILHVEKKSRTFGKRYPSWERPFEFEKVCIGNT